MALFTRFRPRLGKLFAAASLILAVAGAAWAHHSVSAVFDTAGHIQIKGELMDVDWVNPHIFIYVKSTNAKGEVQDWKFESGPPAFYRRTRVNRNTFTSRKGQMVTIDGLPSKDGSTYGFVQKVTFADGDTVESVSAAEASKGR